MRNTQFDVVKRGCNIDVNFATENEVNLSKFEIEVSKNGTEFITLGDISARNGNNRWPFNGGKWNDHMASQ